LATLTTTYSAVFGDVVGFMRRGKAWRQGTLSERLGLSQATISRIERGLQSPNLEQQALIAHVLGLDLLFLLRALQERIEALEAHGIKVWCGPPGEKPPGEPFVFTSGALLATLRMISAREGACADQKSRELTSVNTPHHGHLG
jgi:transcriptional regulator with XRE-family HTH domain